MPDDHQISDIDSQINERPPKADGTMKTPSTDIGELRSKNDQSFEVSYPYAIDQILTNDNNRDGAPIDYESSPRRGQPQSILKRSKKSRLGTWVN